MTSAPSLTLLPPGWTAYYEWNGADGTHREIYALLGFALDEPEEPREAADLYKATFLLVLNKESRATFLNMGRMTLVPPQIPTRSK